MTQRRFGIEQVLVLHAYALAETGGADGVRDETLLEAAVAAPFAGFGSTEFYPTVEAKAARLGCGIIRNRPFVDGNKRVGLLAMLALLGVNGIKLTFTNDELEILGLGIAAGTFDTEHVQNWIEAHATDAQSVSARPKPEGTAQLTRGSAS